MFDKLPSKPESRPKTQHGKVPVNKGKDADTYLNNMNKRRVD